MGNYQGWSQLINTDLGRMAEINYSADPRRKYHNWTHILRGYYHAGNPLGFAYDVNVDAAWLGHDWIYDEHPDKELRSIDAFNAALDQVPPIVGLDRSIVDGLIETTINHSLTKDNRVVKMDLADLHDRKQTAINYDLIASESCELYGIDQKTFAEGSVNFMTSMRQTMMANGKLDDQGQFWSLVLRGIDQTIALSEEMLAA